MRTNFLIFIFDNIFETLHRNMHLITLDAETSLSVKLLCDKIGKESRKKLFLNEDKLPSVHF